MSKISMIGTWRMALSGMEKAFEKLKAGECAVDALVCAVSEVESEPDFISVGFGGLPNCAGDVELDACVMSGEDMSYGAVAGLRKIKNPIKVARELMKESSSNFLLGNGAHMYANAMGMQDINLLTQHAAARYKQALNKMQGPTVYEGHDTVGILALDKNGACAAATSTSGLFMKKPGRMGDSPVPGTGLFADNEAGAAACTGVGEDILRKPLSYIAVDFMRAGLSPKEAAKKTIEEYEKMRSKRPNLGQCSIVCLNRYGETGAYTNAPHFSYVTVDESGAKVYIMKSDDGSVSEIEADSEWIKNNLE